MERVRAQRRFDGAESSLRRGRESARPEGPRQSELASTQMAKKSIKSDLKGIDRLKDSQIDCSDIARLDESFLKRPSVQWPRKKRSR
jgi:hypothetical protein